MRSSLLMLSVLAAALGAAEGGRTYPLWDGVETVESYARRVNLPAAKSVDVGGDAAMELVLIPAGKFVMGSPEPEKPAVTVAGSKWMLGAGCVSGYVLILVLAVKSARSLKLSFSLRWLMLFSIAPALVAGGALRWQMALDQAEKYAADKYAYDQVSMNEKPAHPVTLTGPFYMGKYTVTQAQYQALTGKNPSSFKSGGQAPVECVSWTDATEFCKKLSESMADKTFEARLPTEAQWEYACRAGTTTQFYSGNLESDLDAAGWYRANKGTGRYHPVGQKKPNAFGLYDMHGNVWQWCLDAYADTYAAGPAVDPVGKGGSRLVERGGCWLDSAQYCRSAARRYGLARDRETRTGFRVVMVVR